MTEQNQDNTPPLDEESLRLLAELEGDDGVDGKIADAKVEEKKAAPKTKPKAAAKKKAAPKAKPKAATPTVASERLPTITNVSKNHRRICRVDLAVGESYTLTADDMEDARLMAKLTRAVDLGVLEST